MSDHFEQVKNFARIAWAEGGRVPTTAWIVDCDGIARLLSGIGPGARKNNVSGALAAHRPAGNDILLLVQDDEPGLGPHVLAFLQAADGSERGEIARIEASELGAWEPRAVAVGTLS